MAQTFQLSPNSVELNRPTVAGSHKNAKEQKEKAKNATAIASAKLLLAFDLNLDQKNAQKAAIFFSHQLGRQNNPKLNTFHKNSHFGHFRNNFGPS